MDNINGRPFRRRALIALFTLVLAITPVFSQDIGSVMVPFSSGLRLRAAPSPDGKVLGSLALWERLEVLGVSEPRIMIDGKSGLWVNVRRSSGQEGWCFGGYLTAIDPDDFVPFLALDRKTGEMFTCYNDGQCREKFTLSWNGITIDRMHSLVMSGNGEWIAFYWSDPARRSAREDGFNEYRRLFAYNFRKNKLVLVSSAETYYSDSSSAYWQEEIEKAHYTEPDGFSSDVCYTDLALDYDGTRLFYRSHAEGVYAYDLSSGTRKELFVGYFSSPVFMGNYLYGYTNGGESDSEYELCDLSSGKLTGEKFVSDDDGDHTIAGFAFGRYFLISDGWSEGLSVRDSASGKVFAYPGAWPWFSTPGALVDISGETLHGDNGVACGDRYRVRKFDALFRPVFDASYDVITTGYIRQGMAYGMTMMVGDSIVMVDRCTLHIDQSVHPYNAEDTMWRLNVYKAWALRGDGTVREYELLRETDRNEVLFLAMKP
jgi:hypothetical protein